MDSERRKNIGGASGKVGTKHAVEVIVIPYWQRWTNVRSVHRQAFQDLWFLFTEGLVDRANQ